MIRPIEVFWSTNSRRKTGVGAGSSPQLEGGRSEATWKTVQETKNMLVRAVFATDQRMYLEVMVK